MRLLPRYKQTLEGLEPQEEHRNRLQTRQRRWPGVSSSVHRHATFACIAGFYAKSRFYVRPRSLAMSQTRACGFCFVACFEVGPLEHAVTVFLEIRTCARVLDNTATRHMATVFACS